MQRSSAQRSKTTLLLLLFSRSQSSVLAYNVIVLCAISLLLHLSLDTLLRYLCKLIQGTRQNGRQQIIEIKVFLEYETCDIGIVFPTQQNPPSRTQRQRLL